MTKRYEYNEVEAALCLWEAFLTIEHMAASDTNDVETGKLPVDELCTAPWAAQLEQWGTMAMRGNIIALASVCSKDWLGNGGADLGKVQEKYPSFDWDFCPHWLEHCVDWVNVIPGCHAQPKSDKLRMEALGLAKPSDNLTPKPMRAPVCRRCKGPNVISDGIVRWDAEAQEWSLMDTYDDKSASCDDCEGETRLDWCDIAPRSVLVSRSYGVVAYRTVKVDAPNAKCAELAIDTNALFDPTTAREMGGWTLVWQNTGQILAGYPDGPDADDR